MRALTALNAAVVVLWTVIVLGKGSGTTGPALLGGIPVGVAMVVLARRSARARESPRSRVYLGVSLAFLGLAWLPMALLAAFLVALAEPWPLSLRHGPDTTSARVVFEREIGFAPPGSVSDLYGRRAWAGFGEHLVWIAFRCDDPAVVADLSGRLRLAPVATEEIPSLAVFDGPRWWPARPALQAMGTAYRQATGGSSQVFTHVWHDTSNGRVYVHIVDVG